MKRVLTGILLMAIAEAQTSRGTISGTVMDASGAVVTGARIGLTNTATGARRSAASNEAGIYRFDAVDLGAYELKVTHPGFNAFIATGLAVEANRVTTFDATLEVGAAETAIQVSGESSEMLVKDSPLRGGNFLPRDVSQLPLTGLSPL